MTTIHCTDDSENIVRQTCSVLRSEGRQATVVESVLWNLLAAKDTSLPYVDGQDRFAVVVFA